MSLLNLEYISENILEKIKEIKEIDHSEFYTPEKDHLKTFIDQLYQASFLKEEGRDLHFNVFFGPKEYLLKNHSIEGWKREELLKDYIDLPTQEFNAKDICKIASVAQKDIFSILVRPDDPILFIDGIMYLPKLKHKVNEKKNDILSRLPNTRIYDFNGLIISIRGEGFLTVKYSEFHLLTIESGRIYFSIYNFIIPDESKLLEDFLSNDLKNNKSSMKKYAHHIIMSSLYEINKHGHGGTLLISKKDTYAPDLFEALTKVDQPLFRLDSTNNKAEYSYSSERTIDFISNLSKVDGTVLITPNRIVGFGTIISDLNSIKDDYEIKKKEQDINQPIPLLRIQKETL